MFNYIIITQIINRKKLYKITEMLTFTNIVEQHFSVYHIFKVTYEFNRSQNVCLQTI